MSEIMASILDSIDEGIHAVNKEGITIYYNPKAAALDGLFIEDVVSKHILDVFPSLDRTSSTLLKVLKSQKPILNQQQRYTNYKGREVITVNSTLPIFRHGDFVGAVEISKDVTQVKQLSDKIYQLQRTLFGEQKKNSKSSFDQRLYHFGDIIGNSELLVKVIERAQIAAKKDSTVLVTGETGVGKELLVQSIHSGSSRQNCPFIAQNCAALPESLLESILFGTVKGSFTGSENKPGLFEMASGGTLFLDEINAMPLGIQAKLLRAIEEKKVRRIGDTKESDLDVRIISAMNISPDEALTQGELRKDLYFRLNVVSLNLPPLRERKDDLKPLINYFIDKFNKKFNVNIAGVAEDALACLSKYSWPGNIRELSNYMEQIFNFKDDGFIQTDDLPYCFQELISKDKDIDLREKLYNYEKELIKEAFVSNNKNVSKTAESLGIPRQTLQYKLKQFKLLK